MHRKLTLRLDEALIQKVKRISKKSRVRSLLGALAGAKVSEDD